MRRFSFERPWLIRVLLVALFVRALIPMGFMPAMDRPFSFQICPDGFPAHLLKRATDGAPNSRLASDAAQAVAHSVHHTHEHTGHAAHDGSGDSSPGTDPSHRHNAASSEHCAFAAAAGAPLMAFMPTFSALAASLHTSPDSYVQPAIPPQRFRVQQPRGPPVLS